ncbi:hypothetical protein PR048_003211 [Dryococelus australis]|uniref:Tesmin/TSO1-like CXC domain-containing protein n=1 Tax=Dryococelus australis TaxID=614101 RepID=A0ABQ9IMC7_9NEOP|nr:hypothetical protein PR048_003211 [Dryococelus australis]
MKLFEKRRDLQRLAEVFKQQNCSLKEIVDNGTHFILAMYGAPISEVSIDNYRYLTFAKSTRPNTPVKLSSLTPTAAAAQQHLCRVYYQGRTWSCNELNPAQGGWAINNNILEPIMTLLPPALDVFFNTILCNYTKGCGTNCGCRKVGLPCSIVFGHCRGQSCLNITTDSVSSDDSDEININKTEYDKINPIDYLTSKLTEEEGVNE